MFSNPGSPNRDAHSVALPRCPDAAIPRTPPGHGGRKSRTFLLVSENVVRRLHFLNLPSADLSPGLTSKVVLPQQPSTIRSLDGVGRVSRATSQIS